MVEKQGKKIRAGVSPPPLSGQCPKENIFFYVRASLSFKVIVWSGSVKIATKPAFSTGGSQALRSAPEAPPHTAI